MFRRLQIIALIFTVSLVRAAFAGSADKRLDIYWVDTEGGGATLIVTPAGESVLIDSGNPGARDPGRIANVALKVAGLKQIDNLVVTHYHIDHFGGAADLSKLIPIHTVYDNGNFASGVERPSAAYLAFKAERRVAPDPGDEIPLHQASDDAAAPQLHYRFLAARQRMVEAPAGTPVNPLGADATHKPRDLTDNANSIAQLISFGDFRFFDGGDLTWNVELKLVSPLNRVGTVDVYQSDHHGLDLSNNPVLINSLSPTVAMINNGPRKGCEPAMFKALKATQSIEAIYQQHRNMRPDGNEINVTDAAYIANDEATDGNYVMLSVDPKAKTYTITVPSKNHERTYQVKPQPAPPK